MTAIKEKIMKEAENFVFEEYNVAEDNTEYQYYINENNWLSKCITIKAIQLTEEEKNREFSELIEELREDSINIFDFAEKLRQKLKGETIKVDERLVDKIEKILNKGEKII